MSNLSQWPVITEPLHHIPFVPLSFFSSKNIVLLFSQKTDHHYWNHMGLVLAQTTDLNTN